MGLIIGIIVIILVAAGAFYYYDGGSLPSLGSTSTTIGAASPIVVKSAQLQNNGTLMVDLDNNGQSSTKTIQVLDACSPDFSYCESLSSAPTTSSAPITFVLPPGSEFVENITLAQCGYLSNISPCWGAPIHGQTYYFKLGITFDGGNSIDMPIAATASGTFPLCITCISLSAPTPQSNAISIVGINSSSVELFGNLSGRMAIVLKLDRSLPSSITADLLNTPSGIPPTQETLVSASAGSSNCGTSAAGAPLNCNCLNCPRSATLVATLSTVTTGISPGTYYMVSISITNYGSYFLWVQAQKVTA